jgi:adenylate kinase family enzyme
LFFNCPEEIAKERYLTRKLAGRENDTIDLFMKRHREFEALNAPVVKEYQKRGILLIVGSLERLLITRIHIENR